MRARAVVLEGVNRARRPSEGGQFGTLTAFAIVGASGILVNQAALWGLVAIGGLNYLLSAVIATQFSTTSNFVLNEYWVFRGRSERRGMARRFLGYAAINNAALLLRAPLLALLTGVLGLHYLVSNLLTLILLFAVRFAVSDRLLWRAPETGTVTTGEAGGTGATSTPTGD
jgi:dolichol-phosphate mannosyltransferase